MRRKMLGICLIGLFAMTLAMPPEAEAAADGSRKFDFDVFLDDKKIGTHYFKLKSENGVEEVQSVANFKYTVFFIPAYRYQHQNEERWADNCLVEFNAKTNANGKRIEVSGEKGDAGFRVVDGESEVDLSGCVMSFAYWNPSFLQQSQLLNPQTGEYEDVEVQKIGADSVQVRGVDTPATRFELTSPNARLTLWYSLTDEWIALESTAKSGHIIRYELS